MFWKSKKDGSTLGLENDINSLKEKYDRLLKKLKEMPEIRICSECGQVKDKKEFYTGETKYVTNPHSLLGREKAIPSEYCKSCKPKIDNRKKAIRMAEENPEKVINCVEKKRAKK